MSAEYDNGQVRLLQGDVCDRLRGLPAESVHCVVTSPPYFALRDYGTAVWDGGEAGCEHRPPVRARTDRPRERPEGGTATIDAAEAVYRSKCGKCGAVRVDDQIGLEETPAAYVERLVEVFREVRRVLRPDGTVWLNLGDSYAGSWGNQGRKDERGTQRPINGEMLTPVHDGRYPDRLTNTGAIPAGSGLKAKDLIGIPWRVALALQADGWWLRSEITWCKAAPMPESVTDRPTSATEKVFLLAKAERYYYDADAVAESSVSDYPSGNGYKREPRLSYGGRGQDEQWQMQATRNARNYWLLGPEPYAAAHFAVFPTEIPRRAILAGTSERGCCVECGAPWARYNSSNEDVSGVRNGEASAGLSCAESEMSALRGVAAGRKAGGEYREGAAGGEGLPRLAPGRNQAAQAGLSDGRWSRENASGQPSLFADGSGPGSEAPQSAAIRANGKGAQQLAAEDCTPPSAAHGRDWVVYGDGLAEHPAQPKESLRVLRGAVLGGSPADYRPSDSAEPWGNARRGEHSGGVPPVQQPQVESLTGWRPTCDHDAPVVPCTVLDPFVGSGTTCLVATSLGRRSIGIDLNAEYLDLAVERNRQMALL